MAKRFRYILPGEFELIGLLFVGALVVLLGNSEQLLSYYGLSKSSDILKQSTGTTVTHGLAQLDKFAFTSQAVTFMVWAVVGLLCFSVAQVIGRGYHDFQLEEHLSSNEYIHPMTFTRRRFWEHVGLSFISLLLGLAVLIAGLYLFFGYGLAVGLTDTRKFLQGVSLAQLGHFVLGFAAIYACLVVLSIGARSVIYHQKILS